MVAAPAKARPSAGQAVKSDALLMRVDTLGSRCLFPADAASAQALESLKLFDTVEIKLVKDRSTPQMRLFWAVLKHVAENSKFENAEQLLVALKVRLGYYDLLALPNGKRVPVPHSISFAKMPQDDFQKFMDQSLVVICEDILGGYDSERLIREAQGLVPA